MYSAVFVYWNQKGDGDGDEQCYGSGVGTYCDCYNSDMVMIIMTEF